jgi:hypothetical protein
MFPAAWVLLTPLLLLLPLPASRRQIEGYHLFLTLVAFRGVASLDLFSSTGRKALLAAGIVLASLSSVFVMARDMYALNVAARPGRAQVRMEDGLLVFPFNGRTDRLFAGSPWLGGLYANRADGYFIRRDLLDCLAWTRTGLGPDEAVLCAHETGLLIPVFSGRRVVTGHFGETLDFRSKNAAVRAVTDPELPDHARRLLLASLHADAVIWESRLAREGGWTPAGKEWLKQAWKSDGIAVYRVASPPPAGDYREQRSRSEIAAALFKADGEERMAAGDFVGAAFCFRLAREARPDEPTIRDLLSRITGKGLR